MNKVLVNGVANDQVPIADRGLNYGDGLFETILVKHGQPLFWLAHIERLQQGAKRLSIPFDQSLVKQLTADFQCLLPHAPASSDYVLKIIVTRGVGPRGYKPEATPQLNRIVSLSSAHTSVKLQREGVSVTLCRTQLARQPLLAGIKHLNRLEQVLARSEWQDPDIKEGLVCDTEGYVIEGCMSNLFWGKDGCLYTPDLSQAGVAGIIRQKLLSLCADKKIAGVSEIKVAQYPLASVLSADEIFICNSVLDIVPVINIVDNNANNPDKCLPVGPLTKQCQKALHTLYLEELSC